jgi:hypothetical protein
MSNYDYAKQYENMRQEVYRNYGTEQSIDAKGDNFQFWILHFELTRLLPS